MLTKADRNEWATRLESGEYKQGKYHLERDGKVCCLKILCDIKNIPIKAKDFTDDLGDFQENKATYDKLRKLVNIDDFIDYNDFQELTFPQIADKVKELPTED